MKNDDSENGGPPVTRLVLLGGTKVVIFYICDAQIKCAIKCSIKIAELFLKCLLTNKF